MHARGEQQEYIKNQGMRQIGTLMVNSPPALIQEDENGITRLTTDLPDAVIPPNEQHKEYVGKLLGSLPEDHAKAIQSNRSKQAFLIIYSQVKPSKPPQLDHPAFRG
jgi:hypothetical protein